MPKMNARLDEHDLKAIRYRMKSRRKWDRIRRERAEKARLADSESWQTTERDWKAFRQIESLMATPTNRRTVALAPRQATNAEGKIKREWSGMKGHRYPKHAKAQTVKVNGKNVVVMSQAQRDQALMRKLGMNNSDMD